MVCLMCRGFRTKYKKKCQIKNLLFSLIEFFKSISRLHSIPLPSFTLHSIAYSMLLPTQSHHINSIPSYLITVYNPIPFLPTLSDLILSTPIYSHPILSNSILSYPILSHPIPSHPIPSCTLSSNPSLLHNIKFFP